ncbi:MAG: DUF4358 domain-containing protein [Clostridiales bacterium]|nr:DUF4358 domain-containing protein [Clostridiales bacterium]
MFPFRRNRQCGKASRRSVRIQSALILLSVLLCLCGCSQKQAATIENIADITEKIESILDFDTRGMYDVPQDYMLELLQADSALFTDFVMKIPTGTNQNEYGVFIAAEGYEKEAEETISAYLQARKEAWDNQYLAEEGFKVDRGQSEREGRYVYFVIGIDNFEDVSALFKELAGR